MITYSPNDSGDGKYVISYQDNAAQFQKIRELFNSELNQRLNA